MQASNIWNDVFYYRKKENSIVKANKLYLKLYWVMEVPDEVTLSLLRAKSIIFFKP